MRTLLKPLAALCVAWLASSLSAAGACGPPVKDPIYIGAQACGTCHDGPEMGSQFSKWQLSAHSKAYAALAMPESKEIARLSGITEEPHQSRMCLGCHATASDTEDWEKAESFRLQDGLQCETCHGAGSEYSPEGIMQDHGKAMAHGLRIPTKDDCYVCHRPKGSHDAVLKKAKFDVERAWQIIAHAKPELAGTAEAPEKAAKPLKESPAKFTGVAACAECHNTPDHNFQASSWRRSPHARAYASLSTLKAQELAREAGVVGDPQKASQCLQCHTTGQGFAETSFLRTFHATDGVRARLRGFL